MTLLEIALAIAILLFALYVYESINALKKKLWEIETKLKNRLSDWET